MSDYSLKEIMGDFFEKYKNVSKCVSTKKGKHIIPGYCNPNGYFLLHKDKYPWNKWRLQELKSHLEVRADDNPEPTLMSDLNEFCKTCTAEDINTATDKDSKPRDDGSGKVRNKRNSKKRHSKSHYNT